MKSVSAKIKPLVAAALLSGLTLSSALVGAGSASAATPLTAAPASASPLVTAPTSCGTPTPGQAQCFSGVVKSGSTPVANVLSHGAASFGGVVPLGVYPATLKSIYGFSNSPTAGAGQTIAIVDAYGDPTIEHDLGVFDNQFGLPACTSASGCFTQVDQNGAPVASVSDTSWTIEISLDVEWAHAVAPGAHILLVDATDPSNNNFVAAEAYAMAHAAYVSNSWGEYETNGMQTNPGAFTSPGVSVFFSSGDEGGLVAYPSSDPTVTAVGGTQFNFDANGALTSESGWAKGGGGCSILEGPSAAQAAFSGYQNIAANEPYHAKGCENGTMRATPDVSSNGSDQSPMAVYDTNSAGQCSQAPWCRVYGTSASAPVVAAHAAVAGIQVTQNLIYSGGLNTKKINSGGNYWGVQPVYDLSTGLGVWLPPFPNGYREVASDGGVFDFGSSRFYGSEGGKALAAPVVGTASTPDNNGYWLVAADGGVFSFGDAGFYGSEGGVRLTKPIVGLTPTPDGKGYWLVGSDGGVFAFGDAGFYGSTGNITLTKPVVGIASTPSGKGYWLVASDGGVFAYGDASFYGSTGSTPLTKPVVGIAATSDGKGYWLVAADGGIFAFGDAPFYGSTGGITLAKPAVGITVTPDGGGYWVAAADGGIFAFGDARFYGSMGGTALNKPVVGVSTTNGVVAPG